jgi:hypothetical protein
MEIYEDLSKARELPAMMNDFTSRTLSRELSPPEIDRELSSLEVDRELSSLEMGLGYLELSENSIDSHGRHLRREIHELPSIAEFHSN